MNQFGFFLLYSPEILETWSFDFKFQVFPDCHGKKTNSFVRFLGESMARQSAFSFIWPLDHSGGGGVGVHHLHHPPRFLRSWDQVSSYWWWCKSRQAQSRCSLKFLKGARPFLCTMGGNYFKSSILIFPVFTTMQSVEGLALRVTRLGLWRLMYHSWHKLHFYKKIKCCKMFF